MGEEMIIRCPLCHSVLTEADGSLVCVKCSRSYDYLDGYYDLYVNGDDLTAANYTPKTKHLLYSRDKILSMQHIPSVFPAALFRHQNNWNVNLDKLKDTVLRSGTSERARVEFMVDDYTSEEFNKQEKFTEGKAEIISELLAKIHPEERTVLHVGCGGYANRAIPIMYSEMGYRNWGVDVVRSYVREFLQYGEAHLANAAALPFADKTFDVINFTDILEHLFDPLKALQEAHRVLKHNGYIVIITPNSGFGQAGNSEKIFPGLRTPRTITEEWIGEVYFHTGFSGYEIEQLLSQAGFGIKYIAAKPLNVGRIEKKVSKKMLMKILMFTKLYQILTWTGAIHDPWFVLAHKEKGPLDNKMKN